MAIKDGTYRKAINRSNTRGTRGQLAEALAELLRTLWKRQYQSVSPIDFRVSQSLLCSAGVCSWVASWQDAICRFAPGFRGTEQHDSQEFLAFLLDGLHEDLNYVLQPPPPVEMTPEREAELESLPPQIAAEKEWQIYKQRNDSVLVDWFQGQFRNRMRCLTCNAVSSLIEPSQINSNSHSVSCADVDDIQHLHVSLSADP